MSVTVTFDTFAWIEYFAGSEKGEKAKKFIDGNEIIVTPAVCLFEFKAKYLKEKKEYAQRIEFICSRSRIGDFTKELALAAAEIKKTRGLHAMDAIVYATALHFNSLLLTGDKHFENLDHIEML